MDMWPGIESTNVFAVLKRSMEERIPQDLENEFNYPDGTIRWFDLKISPVPEGIFILSVDITERKGAEEALQESRKLLRESDERFRLALRNSPVSVAVQDLGLNYIWAYNQKTGPEGGFIGMSDSEIFKPEEVARIKEIKRRVLEEDVELREQMWLDRPSGRLFLDITFSPVHDAQGHVTGVGSATVDMTSMKLAEIALKESEAKLHTALESITDAVFISDKEGNFVDFNDAFWRYHRFRSRKECSKGISDCPKYIEAHFSDGTLAPPNMWAVSRALRGETVTQTEYNLRNKDTGDEWWGSYSFSPIRDNKGDIVGSVVVARDITESKKAEKAHEESEERLRTVLDNSLDGINMLDLRNGRYIIMNPAQAEITGFSMDELNGMTAEEAYERTHPDDRHITIEQQKRVAAGEDIGEPVEYRWKVKSGEYRWFSDRRNLVMDETGRPFALVGISRDITDLQESGDCAEGE